MSISGVVGIFIFDFEPQSSGIAHVKSSLALIAPCLEPPILARLYYDPLSRGISWDNLNLVVHWHKDFYNYRINLSVMELGLKNKVAIIGGSSSGIGKAVAFALAEEGCRIVLCGRDLANLVKAKKEIASKFSTEILAVKVDQSNSLDIKRLVKTVMSKFGRIDILITNTGGPKPGSFFDVSEKDWLVAHESLFLYVVRIYNEVIPIMKKQNFGRIINDTSFTVKEPVESLVLSNVYRTAVISLAKTLSRELGRYNITINNICPGFVDTDRLKEIFEARAKKENISVKDVYGKVIEGMPIGRLEKPEEIAVMVAFLASEKASSITGSTINVDGGLMRGLV